MPGRGAGMVVRWLAAAFQQRTLSRRMALLQEWGLFCL
jgi:hypothetical protein